jgi:hypothetical protein
MSPMKDQALTYSTIFRMYSKFSLNLGTPNETFHCFFGSPQTNAFAANSRDAPLSTASKCLPTHSYITRSCATPAVEAEI